MKPKPKSKLAPYASHLRVMFSQVGVRAISPAAVSALVTKLRKVVSGVPPLDQIKVQQGAYFDKRTALVCEVAAQMLPSGLVYFTRKSGHASTSVGDWLLDTEEPK